MGRKLSGNALARIEAERDVWKDVLQGAHEIKVGGGKRTKPRESRRIKDAPTVPKS